MNFIDIASWQHGLDLSAVYRQNPNLDGVIVKVSQHTKYVNPDAKAWLDWLLANGKPAGTYHYLDLYGAEAEAQHYVESVKPWLGSVALAIDYEGNTVRKGAAYLKACLDEVYRLTGVKPFVYVSQSFIATGGFKDIASAGYPLWLAQYADKNTVNGFLEKPWQKGSVSPWAKISMQQYTECGRLSGWKDNLDFDKFFGTAADWAALYGGSAQPEPAPAPAPAPAKLKGPDPVVVNEIISNKFGVGAAREKKLREAGYDPQKCQAKVNELYGVAAKIKPLLAGNMDYINSIIKIVRQR